MLRIIAESEEHPSAEQIHERIEVDFPTTSLATVYKTLSLLKGVGEILELNFFNVISRYDGNKPFPHPHVICLKCGQIRDRYTEFASLVKISQEFARETGYQITHHQLNFFGLCPKCQKEEKSVETREKENCQE